MNMVYGFHCAQKWQCYLLFQDKTQFFSKTPELTAYPMVPWYHSTISGSQCTLYLARHLIKSVNPEFAHFTVYKSGCP